MLVRQLSAQHAHLAAPLILASGEASLRAMFDRSPQLTALGFLTYSLGTSEGQFGFNRHWGLFEGDTLIGTGSCWTSTITQSFKQATLDGLVEYFGWELTHEALDCSSRIAEIIPPLRQNELGIGHLAIVEAHRGKRRVSQLLDFFAERAKQLGKSTLVLDVEAHNHTAVNAYSRFGFAPAERYQPSEDGRAIGLGPHLHMRCSVEPTPV